MLDQAARQRATRRNQCAHRCAFQHSEFTIGVGWQGNHFIVHFRHVSNAHRFGGGKNLGESVLPVGLRG